MNTLRTKGVSSILTTAIIVGGSIVTAFVTAFATSSNSIEKVNGDVRLVSKTEELHYAEVQRQLVSMDKKLDEIIRTSK